MTAQTPGPGRATARLLPTRAPLRVLIVFSHLRWDLVFQRPQHLLTRAARDFDVVYFEEPLTEPDVTPHLRHRLDPSGVRIVTPILPPGTEPVAMQRRLLDGFLARRPAERRFLWYYTPMALAFSDHLDADATVFDCMDELSAFKDPPPGLLEAEARLFDHVDVVFTGGQSLYDAKLGRHAHVLCFPSSIDAAHFGQARKAQRDPADQAPIGRPRIGFFGVIDERMDLELVARTALDLPKVHFVMLGPVVKIDPASLPHGPNLHWLGAKPYADLPAYLANWDAGWMPFRLDASTRYISPTKTPEFLAAGLPVTSTAVPDVVAGYGGAGGLSLVRIAGAADMAQALSASLVHPDPAWRAAVDDCLARGSWDRTWSAMRRELFAAARRSAPPLHLSAALRRVEAASPEMESRNV
ncbi:MAG: glycosyl transferase [Rhodobacteraceae bacterium PARR1]|nr:MAG: glycosyl transferase [Rhodobacteraceae bacterium PARR1]